ncbi:MAG: hypothetical protein HY862_06500 [Chloroflexi bacterium]|nr:hypothetical protein [Chloroflexota bacterium]
MFKQVALMALAVVVLIIGTGVVAAGGGTDDGRLNSGDRAATVAIYYTYGNGTITTKEGKQVTAKVVNGVELWYATKAGDGQKLFQVSAEQIKQAVSANQANEIQIASSKGYSLNYNKTTKAFYVLGPNYVFTWEDTLGLAK